jgi:TPR repeat protein
MPRPKLDEPPIRVQKVDQPAAAVGQTQEFPPRAEPPQKSGWKWPLALGVGVVIVAVAVLVVVRGTGPQPGVAPNPGARPIAAESVPEAAQAYLDKAKAGDVYAMRTLGTWYYYGLNVPQDREKGLYWYHQAAAKGSEAARAELSKIEGGR